MRKFRDSAVTQQNLTDKTPSNSVLPEGEHLTNSHGISLLLP